MGNIKSKFPQTMTAICDHDGSQFDLDKTTRGKRKKRGRDNEDEDEVDEHRREASVEVIKLSLGGGIIEVSPSKHREPLFHLDVLLGLGL